MNHYISGSDGVAFRFKLEKGEHILTLKAVPGNMTYALKTVSEVLSVLSEDYLQIIRISFFERSQKLDLAQGDQLTLMYRFLCWRVRDYQRKQKNQQTLIEKVMRYDLDQEVSLEDRVLWEDFLARLWPKLSLGERRFLFARLCLGLSMNQIMQAYKVSRSTVLNWKRRLAKRFS